MQNPGTLTVRIVALLATLAFPLWAASPRADGAPTIAFGSCLRQWQDQPVWQSVSALSPQAFIFLGDNMYADVGGYLKLPEPERIQRAYQDLAATPQFQAFRATAREQGTALLATWDDHDYGANDGGGDYPHRLASKKYFLEFFGLEQTVSGDSSQPGIYRSQRLHVGELDVQVILLDTRSFRSPIKKDPDSQDCPRTNTVANLDADATVLGEAQWLWLEEELGQPADLRIIASSIQVIPEQHCFEKWANFPRERERLFGLIGETGAEGVVLISGDRHLSEISRLPAEVVGYPLYEITASGLNSAMGKLAGFGGEENRHRVDKTLFDDNFGALKLAREGGKHRLHLQLYLANGQLARDVQVALDELRLPRPQATAPFTGGAGADLAPNP